MAPTYPTVALILACLLSGCHKSNSAARPKGAPHENPELVMEQMKIQSYGPEGKEWELVSPLAKGYTSRNELAAQDIKVQMYRGGQKQTDLTADQGILDTASLNQPRPPQTGTTTYNLAPGDMYMDGHVVVVSSDGTKLNTDWLRYSRKNDLIESTAPVKVTRADSLTTGVGLQATGNLSSVKIFNQTVVIKGQPPKKKNKK